MQQVVSTLKSFRVVQGRKLASLMLLLWATSPSPVQAQTTPLPPVRDVLPATPSDRLPELPPQPPVRDQLSEPLLSEPQSPNALPSTDPAQPDNRDELTESRDSSDSAPSEAGANNQVAQVCSPDRANPDTITIQAFQFTDHTAFTDAELSAVISDCLNIPIGQVQLSRITAALTQLYIDAGYVTSGAIIPQGPFENGILNVRIIEGKLEAIEVLGTQRLAQNYVRDRINAALPIPINRFDLLESLQLLRLDPLIASITAELSSGTQPGTSLLRVQVEEARSFSLQASLDNNRSPSVGSWQRRLQMQQLNLSGGGDRFNIGYGNSEGSNSIDASYSYPINAREGSLDLSFSYTGSDIIEEPFDVLDINSRSTSLELSYRQPLIRTPEREFSLGASLLHRRTRARFIEELNAPFPSPGSDDEGRTIVNELRLSQDYNQRSDRDFLALRSQLSAGLPILGATTQDKAPDATFLAWQGQAQYGRLLAPETLFLARSSVQLASRPLVPLAQFGLGGANTVRGYRQDVLLGDGGWFGSAEVRFPLLKSEQRQASQLQLVPFFDLGGVFNRGDQPEPDPGFIASLGLGLRFESGGDRRFSGRVDYGIPLVEADAQGDSLQARGLHASFQYRLF